MKRSRTRSFAACAVLLLVGCEEEKKATPAAPSVASVPVPPASAAQAQPAKPRPRDPLKVTDLDLTDARRAKIEQAVPEAKGFIEATSLEKDLQKKKLDDEGKDALKAFDAVAKGKWILFRGNITSLKADGFELAITFKPLAPGDAMGLSRKFFMVGFRDVKGYAEDAHAGGQFVVVLAKYSGNKVAMPGYDLQALGNW